MHLFPSEYQNDLMSVKSKSESIQNVKMFNIFLLEGIDASCKDYLISSEGTLSSLANFAHLSLQAEIDEVAVLYAPVLLLILTRFHYFLSARPAFFLSQLLVPKGHLLAEVVKNSCKLLTLKVKNPYACWV